MSQGRHIALKIQECHPPNTLSCPAPKAQAEFTNEVSKVNGHLRGVSWCAHSHRVTSFPDLLTCRLIFLHSQEPQNAALQASGNGSYGMISLEESVLHC